MDAPSYYTVRKTVVIQLETKGTQGKTGRGTRLFNGRDPTAR